MVKLQLNAALAGCLFSLACGGSSLMQLTAGTGGSGPSGASSAGSASGSSDSTTGASASGTSSATGASGGTSGTGLNSGESSGGTSGFGSTNGSGFTTTSSTTGVGIGSTTARQIKTGTAASSGGGGGSSTTGGMACVPPSTLPVGDPNSALQTFGLGGQVFGLVGTLGLSDGVECVSLAADGGSMSYYFPTPLPDLTCYNLSVLEQTGGQRCVPQVGSGCLAGAQVNNLEIDCCASSCQGNCSSRITQTFSPYPPSDWANTGYSCCGETPGPATGHNASGIDPNLLELIYWNANASKELMYFKTPLVMDDFNLSFQFRLTDVDSHYYYYLDGEGLGFFMTPTKPNVTNTFSGDENDLGMGHLGGVGFEFDLVNDMNCSDSTANHVGVDLLTPCGTSTTPTSLAASDDLTATTSIFGLDANCNPSMADDVTHTVVINVVKDVVKSFSIDGTRIPAVENVDLTAGGQGLIPGSPVFIGFSAGVSGKTDEMQVGNVVLAFPAPLCQ